MASLYKLKPAFQRLLRPVVDSIFRIGIRPNGVTLFALGLSVSTGVLLATYGSANATWYILLPIVLVVRMALNAIDGMLARQHNLATRLGAILNELGDVVSDACLYLPFIAVAGVHTGWVVAAVLLSGLTEMAGILGLTIGASRRYDGPMGKSDRALYFGCIGFLHGIGVNLTSWMAPVWWTVIMLLGITVIRRIQQALQESSSTS